LIFSAGAETVTETVQADLDGYQAIWCRLGLAPEATAVAEDSRTVP
jgi:hypothetical protein